MANVYQRGAEYLYSSPEPIYQSIEYYYWPIGTGTVNSIMNGIPAPVGTQAILEYENAEYLWQDGYSKIFGVNIEYIYTSDNPIYNINSVMSASYTPGTGSINSIMNAVPSSNLASGFINSVMDGVLETFSGTGYINSIMNGITIRQSGFINSIIDAYIPPPPTGGTFVYRTYMPFAPRRIPFISRVCGDIPSYTSGDAAPTVSC